MIAPIERPLFELGKVAATPAALKAIEDSGQEPADFLNRHVHGDWGSVFDEERVRNDDAVATGEKIASVYRTGNGIQIWIITQAADSAGKRASTTILLPAEYQK